MQRRRSLAIVLSAVLLTAGCAAPTPPGLGPVTLARDVDLARFMGDWFVIANIPTSQERGAHNSREHYALRSDGTIATTFTFNADGFDGPRKQYESTGFVEPGTDNAVWGQQYVWPFKADYRIAYVSPDYRTTVIARDKRDYVWIMARTPTLPAADLARLEAFVASQGYDAARLQPVPQASGR